MPSKSKTSKTSTSKKRPLNVITLNKITVDNAYWRKRPNIVRTNGTVKLPRQAYDARALNKWIKMSQEQEQDAIVFPDNRMPMSEKEMYAISLVATVPRAHRKEYRLLVRKRKKLENSLKRLYKLEEKVKGIYSHNKKLEEIVEETKKAIVWSDKQTNTLLKDEFRFRLLVPKMYRKELRLLVTKRKKLDQDLIRLYDAKFKLKEQVKEIYSDNKKKKLEEEVKETKKAIVSLDKSMNTLRRPIQTSPHSKPLEQTVVSLNPGVSPWNSPGVSHRSPPGVSPSPGFSRRSPPAHAPPRISNNLLINEYGTHL